MKGIPSGIIIGINVIDQIWGVIEDNSKGLKVFELMFQ